MFLSPVTCPEPTGECDAERRVRQLAMLRRLAEIGMALAEIAGRDALREAEETSAAVPPATPEPRRRDPKLLFARLASGVRQAIAMERRVATEDSSTLRRPIPAAMASVAASTVDPDAAAAEIASVFEAAAAGPKATGRGRLMGSSAGTPTLDLLPTSLLGPRKTGPPPKR